MPTQRKGPRQRKMGSQRRDYRRRRDQSGRFSSTGMSVRSRRQVRALRWNGMERRKRKTASEIYNERGGLKSQKAIRAAKKRKFVSKTRKK